MEARGVTLGCEVPGCKKPIKLDTEPWTRRRLPGTNRVGVVCEPCANEIDATSEPDPADLALEQDAQAALSVDRAVQARRRAQERQESPYKPPRGAL